MESLQPVDCDCTSAVGEMDLNAINECGDGPIAGIYNSVGENFDGDDVLEFVLHTGSGTMIEYPIIARADTPVFSFDPGQMNYGDVYYIYLHTARLIKCWCITRPPNTTPEWRTMATS